MLRIGVGVMGAGSPGPPNSAHVLFFQNIFLCFRDILCLPTDTKPISIVKCNMTNPDTTDLRPRSFPEDNLTHPLTGDLPKFENHILFFILNSETKNCPSPSLP